MHKELVSELGQIANQIGVNTYKAVGKKDAAVIAFGMTPLPLIEEFREKMSSIISDHLAAKVVYSETEAIPGVSKVLKPVIQKAWMAELERQFCLGLMKAASQVGKMIA